MKAIQIRDDLYTIGDKNLTVTKYKMITSVTKTRPPLKQVIASADIFRLNFAVTVYKDCTLYITAGKQKDDVPTDSVLAFDINTRQFNQVERINIPRSFHSSTSAGSCIYIIAGYGRRGQLLIIVEKYDLSNKKPRWQKIRTKFPESVGN